MPRILFVLCSCLLCLVCLFAAPKVSAADDGPEGTTPPGKAQAGIPQTREELLQYLSTVNPADLPFDYFTEDPDWSLRLGIRWDTSRSPKAGHFYQNRQLLLEEARKGNALAMLLLADGQNREFWEQWAARFASSGWVYRKNRYISPEVYLPLNQDDAIWLNFTAQWVDEKRMRSAAMGYPPALIEIGESYVWGENGFPQNTELGCSYRLEAGKRGAPTGWYGWRMCFSDRAGEPHYLRDDAAQYMASAQATWVLLQSVSEDDYVISWTREPASENDVDARIRGKQWAAKALDGLRRRAEEQRKKTDPLLPELNKAMDELIRKGELK